MPLFCSNAKETAVEVSSRSDVQVPQAREPTCLGFFPQLFQTYRVRLLQKSTLRTLIKTLWWVITSLKISFIFKHRSYKKYNCNLVEQKNWQYVNHVRVQNRCTFLSSLSSYTLTISFLLTLFPTHFLYVTVPRILCRLHFTSLRDTATFKIWHRRKNATFLVFFCCYKYVSSNFLVSTPTASCLPE